MIGILQRAEVLIEQKRFSEAEKMVQPLLADYSENEAINFCMARIRMGQKNYSEAKQFAGKVLTLDPDNPSAYYLLSILAFQESKEKEAEELIKTAIQKNPHFAPYFSHLSHIKIVQKDFELGLKYADQGLSIDPEDIACLNMKSMALTKLKRSEEAERIMEDALGHDPHDPYTHANRGWALLEKGRYAEAEIHFGEALKNNPSNQYAKSGLVEAMKARNPLYRLFLKYAFWLGNMKGQAQWMIIIGAYVIYRILIAVSSSNPMLAKFIQPFLILYVIFALSSWLISPLSNLFLRLNKYGRYALSKTETISSNFVGGFLLISILGFASKLVFNHPVSLMIGFYGFAMMLPTGVMLMPSVEKNKKILIGYTVALGSLGLLAILTALQTGVMFSNATTLFLVGIFIFQWVANGLVIARK